MRFMSSSVGTCDFLSCETKDGYVPEGTGSKEIKALFFWVEVHELLASAPAIGQGGIGWVYDRPYLPTEV